MDSDKNRVMKHISIHAPARGATTPIHEHVDDKAFQSTRPRGARRYDCSRHSNPCDFNPRAREGRDASQHPYRRRRRHFNPRAREGRDMSRSPISRARRNFNPRAREGRDVRPDICLVLVARFQSTRPRGARPGFALTATDEIEFQSTRPRGARQHIAVSCGGNDAFQSTRPRGARPRKCQK